MIEIYTYLPDEPGLIRRAALTVRKRLVTVNARNRYGKTIK